ncbi:MAG: GGDEF domain-containing protein [Alphaproteobacteria bacterium]|nr:GGDEF domain-containing protein [Alphaproteobacteria bacterium]
MTPADLRQLASLKDKIAAVLGGIVDEFYQKQTAIEDVVLLIGDAETMTRLRRAQYDYVLELFCGIYDADYVNNRLRIGLVHKRIGVEPKLYLSAIKTLKDILTRVIRTIVEDPAEANEIADTLDKLIYFDTTLVFDTYIQSMVGEIAAAKIRTEKYAEELARQVEDRTRELETMARTDPLTGLYNRRSMTEVFERELAHARRKRGTLCCAYFDVDKFKSINDEKGHVFGDQVLIAVGKAIEHSIREVDIGCRYGGDEFCIVLPDCSLKDACSICERIIAHFNQKFPQQALSIGIVQKGIDDVPTAQELIEAADKKMYQAKEVEGSHIAA